MWIGWEQVGVEGVVEIQNRSGMWHAWVGQDGQREWKYGGAILGRGRLRVRLLDASHRSKQ